MEATTPAVIKDHFQRLKKALSTAIVEVGLLHFTLVYNNVTAWEKVKYF